MHHQHDAMNIAEGEQELQTTHYRAASNDGDLPTLLQQAKERICSSERGKLTTSLSDDVLMMKTFGPEMPDPR